MASQFTNQSEETVNASYPRREYSGSHLCSYSPASINFYLNGASSRKQACSTSYCRLKPLQKKPASRATSSFSYSHQEKAFYDATGCLWVPAFLSMSAGSSTSVNSTKKPENQKQDVAVSSPPIDKLTKSWIWAKPKKTIIHVESEKKLVPKVPKTSYSEWMRSPYLGARWSQLSLRRPESRSAIDNHRNYHKCKSWLDSSLE